MLCGSFFVFKVPPIICTWIKSSCTRSLRQFKSLQHTFASLRSLYLSVPIFRGLFSNSFSQNGSNSINLCCVGSVEKGYHNIAIPNIPQVYGVTRARCPASFSRSCRKRSWPKQPGDRCQLQKLVPGTQVHTETLKMTSFTTCFKVKDLYSPSLSSMFFLKGSLSNFNFPLIPGGRT